MGLKLKTKLRLQSNRLLLAVVRAVIVHTHAVVAAGRACTRQSNDDAVAEYRQHSLGSDESKNCCPGLTSCRAHANFRPGPLIPMSD